MRNPGFADIDESFIVLFEHNEGECVGCDVHTTIDDLGLCEECAAKLDRDMIRERSWDHSLTAWGCPSEKREELRQRVISEWGAGLELIALSKPKKKARTRKGTRPKMRSKI